MATADTETSFIQDELDSAYIYEALADLEESDSVAELYRRLAATEQRHAETWVQRTGGKEADLDAIGPSRRARILVWLARRFGAQFVLPSLTDQEQADRGALRRDTRGRADGGRRALARAPLANAQRRGGGRRHRATGRSPPRHGGNALRAAVLGANDGLLSNFSLVMGVAGPRLHRADPHHGAGRASGRRRIDGARRVDLGAELARAAGAPDRDRVRRVRGIPDEERQELALIYRRKGWTRTRRTALPTNSQRSSAGPRHPRARGARDRPR